MNTCVACGKNGVWVPYWPRIRKCQFCTHCVADLNIDGLDFERLYDENYFSGSEYVDYLADRPVFQKQFAARLGEVLRYRKSGLLIEIGCAYGLFLDLARRSFAVRGYDISQAATQYAVTQLGLDARCQDFVNAGISTEKADVIVMWDVIEHLPHPDLTVITAGQVLRPGGYLFLTTGDIGSFLARLRRGKWRLIHPPTHLHYFTRKSIRCLLERAELSTIQIKCIATRRSIRQVAYSICMLGQKKYPRLYRWINASALANCSFELNTSDIMLVVAQKIPK